MRHNGALTKWNDDRGFGFIAPTPGNQEIFVHISAFPRDGKRPRIGESLSFEIETAGDGKKRAVSVLRPPPAGVVRHRSTGRQTRSGPSRRLLRNATVLAVLGALGIYGYLAHVDTAKGNLFASDPEVNPRGALSENKHTPQSSVATGGFITHK